MFSHDWQVAVDSSTESDVNATSQNRLYGRRSSRSRSSGLFERVLSIRRRTSDSSAFDPKGALGLNLLFSPSEPLIDFIFVHGLGGGSTKTWCLAENPDLFWPKTWLPQEPAFRNIRSHSFGYDADWTSAKGPSTLNIHDFGLSLLGSLRNSPYLRSSESSPIVCVGHSMGGLVIKQAYVLARQDPSCSEFAKRIEAMVFLATPHRGSDLAALLNSVLRASGVRQPRAYLTNLDRASELLALLNDSFRHYSQDLTLFSFYESQQTNMHFRSDIIVPRDSAVMGYTGERSAPLNADHRHVCKFETPLDPNYIAIRDALQSIIEPIMKRLSSLNVQKSWKEMQEIDSYLGSPGRPEDDLVDLDEARIAGSCEWFLERESFQKWLNSDGLESPRIFWLCARPATGKSVLSGYIVKTLSGFNFDCSYYFFRHGDKGKSTISGLLRSILFQMCLGSINVRQKLQSTIDRGVRVDKDDAKVLWRKLLVPAISQLNPFQTQFWILDALDECSDFDLLFPMLASIDSTAPIKILITSRKLPEIVQRFADLQRAQNMQAAICEEIAFDDTRADIALYLESNRQKLHVGNDAERERFLSRMLEKSEGCFLWVRLVLDELTLAWTVNQVERILEETPQNMDPLYTRALSIMSSKPAHSKDIARAILTWTVCAVRPLTVPEIRRALQIDLGDEISDIESAIASLCAQLVHVDKIGRILMVHLTARTFLTDPQLESDFSVNEKSGHLRLARICLQYLCSEEMKPPRVRRSKRVSTRRTRRSPFVAYASLAFAEHLRQSSSKNHILSSLLYNFLEDNVLSWIEHIASTGNLATLSRTANSFKAYLQRHIQNSSPLGEFVQVVERWVLDLHRIVAKFGTNLISSPASIYCLIPPFCPVTSAIASSCKSSSNGLVVKGLTDMEWDDRISCIDSHNQQATSVACGEAFFAIGFSHGNIVLHNIRTCQEWKTLVHGGPVRQLCFSSIGILLASSSKRDIRIWDFEGGFMLLTFSTAYDVLDFSFQDKDGIIMAATRGDSVHSWSLKSGQELSKIDWAESLPFHNKGQFWRPPLTAAFSPDLSMVAIVYRGRPISLYELEEKELHGLIGREKDPTSLALGTNTSVASLVFNSNEAIPLLAAAYEDGDLCLFHYEELTLLKILEANAQIVACSPDGLTLATGNSVGMVQLMDFETLQLLYRVNAVDYGIRCMAFSADNLCFLDVRGTQCNIWEPPVLSGLAKRDEMSTEAALIEPIIKGLSDDEVEITQIVLEGKGEYFFVGKSDGEVCVYDTLDGKQRKSLYRHTYQIPVTSMVWGSQRNVIVTADAASRFIVCLLAANDSTGWALSAKLMDKHMKSAILGVLLNPANDLLLVSTSQLNTIWDIENKKQMSSEEAIPNASFTWVNHPLNEEQLVLLAPHSATVIDWKPSNSPVPNNELQLPKGVLSGSSYGVKNAFSFANNQLLALELSELYGERSTTQLLILESGSFSGQKGVLVPLVIHPVIGKEMLHLIGASDQKLIFLSKSRWVCSFDVRQSEHYSYIRHFPIPSDWPSQQRVLRMALAARGDILFVRTDKVAVIKNGLEFEELVTLESIMVTPLA